MASKASKKKVSVKAVGVGAKVNETTSRRVAKIAGQVLKALDREMVSDAVLIHPKAQIEFMGCDIIGYTVLVQICTVADLKALAASCLTQTYNKKDGR